MKNNKTESTFKSFLKKNTTNINLIESINKKAKDSIKVKSDFFKKNNDKIIKIAQIIANSYKQNGHLFAMGNGGSSCDAAHIVTEFMHPITTGRRALAATSLNNDIATTTAIANDVNYDHIFLRQIMCLAKANDVLIGFSTSGNSNNLLSAFAQAKKMGLYTIGFSGQTGGKMAKNKDINICLTVETDSIHRVQETHLVTYHILWDLVHSLL